jgi:hypothetical protein
MKPAPERGAEGVRLRLVRISRLVLEVVEVGHVTDVDDHLAGRGSVAADLLHRLVEVRLLPGQFSVGPR